MKIFNYILLTLCLIILAVIIVIRFFGKDKESGNNTVNITPNVTAETGATPAQTVIVTSAPAPNPTKQPVDFDSMLPKIDFGMLLVAFENDDGKSKSYAYAEVAKKEVTNYKSKLIDMGYEIKSEDDAKDEYKIQLKNSDLNSSVSIVYSNGGKTLNIKISVG